MKTNIQLYLACLASISARKSYTFFILLQVNQHGSCCKGLAYLPYEKLVLAIILLILYDNSQDLTRIFWAVAKVAGQHANWPLAIPISNSHHRSLSKSTRRKACTTKAVGQLLILNESSIYLERVLLTSTASSSSRHRIVFKRALTEADVEG